MHKQTDKQTDRQSLPAKMQADLGTQSTQHMWLATSCNRTDLLLCEGTSMARMVYLVGVLDKAPAVDITDVRLAAL